VIGRKPVVRNLEPAWIEEGGEKLLVLRDREGLMPAPAAVPPIVGLVLSLCDGARDEDAIRSLLERETGQAFAADELSSLIDQLEEALILDSARAREARGRAIEQFRAAPRPALLADAVYPADPTALRARIAEFGRGAFDRPSARDDRLRGAIAPHIDYTRGGKVYHRVFERAAPAMRAADLLVVFGTDHSGAPGAVTLTRQSFETPFGRFETDRAVVDAIAAAIGEENAFAEELHHRGEHSIELGLVWAAAALGDQIKRPAVVPVLCGSFHDFTAGRADPAAFARFTAAVDALRKATEGKRVFTIAAADLAHVGPAFGDARPIDEPGRARLREADERLLHAAAWGRPDELFGQLRDERDARRICGLPPIYLTLKLLGDDARGEVVAYEQCPADDANGSFVSVGGMLLW
jgi:AmmeMemoRadiSam system protein B